MHNTRYIIRSLFVDGHTRQTAQNLLDHDYYMIMCALCAPPQKNTCTCDLATWTEK